MISGGIVIAGGMISGVTTMISGVTVISYPRFRWVAHCWENEAINYMPAPPSPNGLYLIIYSIGCGCIGGPCKHTLIISYWTWWLLKTLYIFVLWSTSIKYSVCCRCLRELTKCTNCNKVKVVTCVNADPKVSLCIRNPLPSQCLPPIGVPSSSNPA